MLYIMYIHWYILHTRFGEATFDISDILTSMAAQAAQTLFVIYIRDSIALRFDPSIKRMYENGLKIALNVSL